MATSQQVLSMLIPNGGWVQVGDTYEGITFLECDPITKEEFEAGFVEYDSFKLAQENAKESKKLEILDRLGLTAEEALALLS